MSVARATRFENGQFTKELLKPKPDQLWILVTSAYHMPRAVAVFRKAGFSIIAYPVDYHTNGDASDFTNFSVIDNLSKVDTATKEWIGLMVYWLAGRTDELLPDPNIR